MADLKPRIETARMVDTRVVYASCMYPAIHILRTPQTVCCVPPSTKASVLMGMPVDLCTP